MKNNKKRNLIVSSTVVGLVCGLALTQQQVKAATEDPTNGQSNVTSVVQAPNNDNNSTAEAQTPSEDQASANVETTNDNADNAITENSNNMPGKQKIATKAGSNSELIEEGTCGTCKWEYKHEDDDYVLHLHAGIFEGSISPSSEQITKIIIDPNVIVGENSASLFSGLTNLKTIEGLTNLDTSRMTDMQNMFLNCHSLTSLDLSNFNTANVIAMSEMFNECSSLTSLDLGSFDNSNVKDMAYMFAGCTKLTTVSNFDIGGAFFLPRMFENCTSLTNVDISGLNSENIDMQHFFSGCSSLVDLDLSSLKVGGANVTDIFEGCTKLANLNLSHLNFYDASDMFKDCVSLNHLVLGISGNENENGFYYSKLPEVPAIGTPVPGTNKKVTAPYWVATSGYEQGKQYTSEELMKLNTRDQVTTYDWVAAVPVAETTTETKAVSRLINVHQPDGTNKNITQTEMIKREVRTNEDGSVDYGDWSTAQWDTYKAPTFAGYEASIKQVPAAVINGETTDQVIDIFYEPVEQTITVQYLDKGKVVGTQQFIGYAGETITPIYHAPAGYELATAPQPTIKVDASGNQVIKVSVNHKLVESTELKTITRTINIHQPDHSIKTINQVAIIRRSVTIDQATGKKSVGTWHTDIWEKYRLPQIAGYTPSKSVIPTKVVNGNSQNERVEVYYQAKK